MLSNRCFSTFRCSHTKKSETSIQIKQLAKSCTHPYRKPDCSTMASVGWTCPCHHLTPKWSLSVLKNRSFRKEQDCSHFWCAQLAWIIKVQISQLNSTLNNSVDILFPCWHSFCSAHPREGDKYAQPCSCYDSYLVRTETGTWLSGKKKSHSCLHWFSVSLQLPVLLCHRGLPVPLETIYQDVSPE